MAIGNCAYKFLLRHRAFVRKSARGLTEVSRSHGRVSTRGHHIYKNTSTPLLGEVLEYKIESGNLQDRYAVAVQHRKTVVGHGKKSAACPLFLQRAGRIRCTVIGVRCFPNHACPLLRRVAIVFASRTSFLRLRGLTFDATLAFALSQGPFGLGRMTRSHVIFLGNVCPSCEKYTCMYKVILSLHVQTSLRVRSTPVKNDIQQNFGRCKIWRELNLAALTPIAKPPN